MFFRKNRIATQEKIAEIAADGPLPPTMAFRHLSTDVTSDDMRMLGNTLFQTVIPILLWPKPWRVPLHKVASAFEDEFGYIVWARSSVLGW